MRIKGLEENLKAQKKKKEEIETEKKLDQNRFFKFKQDFTKDI